MAKTLPDLLRLHPIQASLLGLNSRAIVGSPVSRIAFLAALVVAALGIVLGRGQTREPSDSFYLYLAAIAIQTALAYALTAASIRTGPGWLDTRSSCSYCQLRSSARASSGGRRARAVTMAAALVV